MGNFDHSSRSVFARSHTDVGWEGLALSLCSNSSQRCVLSGWGQDSVQASQLHPHQTLSFISLWTLLCALVPSHVGTGRGHPLTVPTKLGAWNCPTIVPYTGTEGPSPAPEKQPHTITHPQPNFTLGTMQSDKYRSPGNRQSLTHPLDCQMEKRDLSLQRERLHCSRVQWRRALHHCIRRFALHLLIHGLDAAMETHSIKLSMLCSWSEGHIKFGGL